MIAFGIKSGIFERLPYFRGLVLRVGNTLATDNAVTGLPQVCGRQLLRVG